MASIIYFLQIDSIRQGSNVFNPSYTLAYILMIAGILVLLFTLFHYFRPRISENKLRGNTIFATVSEERRPERSPVVQPQVVEEKEVQKKSDQKHHPYIKYPEKKRSEVPPFKFEQEKEKIKPNPPVLQESKQDQPVTSEQKKPVKKRWFKIVEPGKEEQTVLKYIGYKPTELFDQSGTINFPIVVMPAENSVIKFPRKGRVGQKGYKADEFRQYLNRYFTGNYLIYDDHFILTPNIEKPLEPDFILIDEKWGLNIFMDIEIDEPYEGLDDIDIRKATHFQDANTNWNASLMNRGWIVIRFAEIQIHQQPESCCLFIADVLTGIHPNIRLSPSLLLTGKVKPVKQWTKEEAEQWSKQKYREKYLGITSFGYVSESEQLGVVTETTLGAEIEKQIEYRTRNGKNSEHGTRNDE